MSIIYPDALGPEPTITDALIKNHGSQNVYWLDFMANDSGDIIAYLLFGDHIANKKIINQQVGFLKSKAKINYYFIDYSSQGNKITPDPYSRNDPYAKAIDNLIGSSHLNYQSARKSKRIISFSYFWNDKGKLKGLKHTSFSNTINDEGDGEWCTRQMHSRPTWNSPLGPIAYKSMISVAKDLSVDDYKYVIVNSEGDPGTAIVTDGNAYAFDLNYSQLELLYRGTGITNGTFYSYEDFLANL